MIAIEVLEKFIKSNKVVIHNHNVKLDQILKDLKQVTERITEVEKENKDIEATITVLKLMEKGS